MDAHTYRSRARYIAVLSLVSMAHYPVPAIMGGVIWPISVFETDENMVSKKKSELADLSV